jgi:hypothetical protein
MSVTVQERPTASPYAQAWLEMILQRSPLPVYRTGMECPGCGGWAWNVGRSSAACPYCGTCLPLPDAITTGTGLVARKGKR